MPSGFAFILFLFSALVSISLSQSVIRLPNVAVDRKSRADDALYCDSWRLSVETDNAGSWEKIPARCEVFVGEYMTGPRYLSDSQIIAKFSKAFAAASINISGDGKEAWVFDIDETLLSNLPYYGQHGFGSKPFNETTFNLWVDEAKAPALPASLSLYNDLKQMGFKIFLLTGRSESQRNVTSRNLFLAGYTDWERLILRGSSDEGKPAIQYKSEKRSELISEGYKIEGSSGDQWSDLLGFAVATRSFKLPNPMYYIA